jgi:hypothetical protein
MNDIIKNTINTAKFNTASVTENRDLVESQCKKWKENMFMQSEVSDRDE